MNAQEILAHLMLTVQAHSLYAKSPKKAVRFADGKTPYSVHPIWCAMTIACEHALPEPLRLWGIEVLFFHDVIEDTDFVLPTSTGSEVKDGVRAMTFESYDAECEHIWEAQPEIRLLKLYDKVSNLLDAGWMPKKKLEQYKAYTRKLAVDVKNNFGDLNIVRIAFVMTEEN